VLRPLPLPHPEQLVQVTAIYRNHSRIPISYPLFTELEREQRAFSGICGWTAAADFNVETNGKMSLSDVRSVTGLYYSVLSVHPFLGRLINPSDVQGSQVSQVAVISYEVWNHRFAADPAIVGKTIRIEGKLFTIIGVTQKRFTGMTIGSPREITIPAGAGQLYDMQSRSQLWLFVAGRLTSGNTMEHAQAQLQSFWPHLLETTLPTESIGQRRQSFLAMGLALDSAATGANGGINGELRSKVQRPLYLLLSIVALILLVVCVNLTSLTLARGSYRRQEISTRIALGASPWQAVRLFVIETLVLSGTGALLALPLSYWGSQFLIALMTHNQTVPILLEARLACVLFCRSHRYPHRALHWPDPCVAALSPTSRIDTAAGRAHYRPGHRSSRQSAYHLPDRYLPDPTADRRTLLANVAKSQVLRPWVREGWGDRGSSHTVPAGFRRRRDGSYRRQLAEAVTNLPSVRSAAISSIPIPAGDDGGWKETVSLQSDPNPADNVTATLAAISPGFFKTLAIPFVSGRDFTWADDKQHPHIAIIDSLLAKQLFPSENPIGKRIRFGVQPDFQDIEIVGVSQSARILDIRDASAALIYVPALQFPSFAEGGTLLVRGSSCQEFAKAVDAELQCSGMNTRQVLLLWKRRASAPLSTNR
jgi:MacB-like periplasmic core domain